MKNYLCRIAKIEDLDELIKLRVLMQKEVNNTPLIHDGYLEDIRQYFKTSILNNSYTSAVAEARGMIVAATGLVLFRKPPSLTGRKGIIGYITNVYTLPNWRGRGIATKLMELTIQEAKRLGADQLKLGTREHAKGVYERVGFKTASLPSLELNLY